MIAGPDKQSIEAHFDKSYELEEELKSAGKLDRLDRIQDISSLVDIHYVRQKERNGLGDAVPYAQKHVGNEPFALLLGDTIIQSETPCVGEVIRYAEEYDESVLSLEQVPWDRVESYGVAKLNGADEDEECFPVEDFVEKPPREEASSNLASTGRYVLTPETFDLLEQTEPGVGGELQLTDAIRALESVRGVGLTGDWFDIRNIPGWLKANIEMALSHDDGEMNAAVKQLISEMTHE